MDSGVRCSFTPESAAVSAVLLDKWGPVRIHAALFLAKFPVFSLSTQEPALHGAEEWSFKARKRERQAAPNCSQWGAGVEGVCAPAISRVLWGHECAAGSPVEFVLKDCSLSTSHPVAQHLSDWITHTQPRRWESLTLDAYLLMHENREDLMRL